MMPSKNTLANLWRRSSRRGRSAGSPPFLDPHSAAAIRLVLAHFGRFVPIDDLTARLANFPVKSKAAVLIGLASSFGLRGRAFRRESRDLQYLPVPMVVFWHENRLMVVEGFGTDGSVLINDPAPEMSPEILSEDQFQRLYSGVAVVFQQTSSFEDGKEPGLGALISQRMPRSVKAISFITLASLALIVPSLLTPAFSSIFVDDILVGKMARWAYALVVIVILAALVKSLTTHLQQVSLLRLEAKLGMTSSSKVLWHIFRLPKSFLDRFLVGEICSWLDLSDRVAVLLAGDIVTNIAGIVLLVFYLALMLKYDVLLSTVTIGIVSINLVVIRQLANIRTEVSKRILQKRGRLFATATSGLQSIETLKATGFEARFFSLWAGHQTGVINEEQKAWTLCIPLMTLPGFLIALNFAAIIYFGGERVMGGKLTMGMLVGFQTLVVLFFDPVIKLVDLGGKLQDSKTDMLKISEILQTPEDHLIGHEGMRPDQWANILKLDGSLEVKDVTFGYDRHQPPTIKNLSVTLSAGERVAFVGSSGSGKSTIAKLLSGLYEPWNGDLAFGGYRRRTIPRGLVNESVGFVDQDIFLFEGSIRENLTLWDSTVDDSVMIQAARDACIHDEIIHRIGGYDSHMEEGGKNFSGGQRQRLEIARALILDPTLLILDEATSALDPATEQMVDANLRRRGCTCVVIAHRLSTIRDCNEIIVLENGVVVQRGNHAGLREIEGPYAELLRAI